ncbi:hypothetical protein HMPREF9712_03619, partial [Myroides odoratimimus CCUG 10230]
QYLYGAVKSGTLKTNQTPSLTFQYLYGAVKSYTGGTG